MSLPHHKRCLDLLVGVATATSCSSDVTVVALLAGSKRLRQIYGAKVQKTGVVSIKERSLLEQDLGRLTQLGWITHRPADDDVTGDIVGMAEKGVVRAEEHFDQQEDSSVPWQTWAILVGVVVLFIVGLLVG